MASSKCSIDECKRTSDTFCDHCQKQVCTKHYIEHVRAANSELEFFSDELNCLMDALQRQEPKEKALMELEKWREENHRKIDEIYEGRKIRLQIEMSDKVDIEMARLRIINGKIKDLIDDGDASFKEIEQIKINIEQSRKRCHEMHLNNSSETAVDLVPIPTQPDFNVVGRLLLAKHQNILNEWIGQPNIQWKLVYQASRDGFNGEDFHRLCDGVAPTVTIIESKLGNYLFGGYTSMAWHQLGCYTTDLGQPFIFTLTNPYHIPPTKYLNHHVQFAIFGSKTYGPTFGGGHDIYTSSNSDKNMNNTFNFPHTYIDTTNRGALTFTGQKNFQTNEIEVYQLKFSN